MGLVILCQQIQISRRGRLRGGLEKVGDLVEMKWERQKYRAILWETERGWEKEERNKDRYLGRQKEGRRERGERQR